VPTSDGTQSAAAAGATTAAEVLAFAKERGTDMVDLKFVDLPGTWQHMTLPLTSLDEGDFEHGLGFDGSSIRGFQEIHESDMLLIPDATTAFIDPFYTRTTLSLICSIADPVVGEPYGRDPRFVAQKAEQHLAQTGIADVAYFGPEAEFFVFDHLAYEQREHRAFYEIDSQEGFWNTGEIGTPGPNLAYKGFEAPVNLVYSARNRSACVRVPMYHEAPKTKRIEFRSPDPTANPYLAFSALMLAGLDGIKRRLDPGEPLDADIYELPAERLASIGRVPSSLEASLDALENDNADLLEGDVFTSDLLESYVRWKREAEVDAIRLRPHPWEFALYHDA
jgi:glutamine synthetase